MADPATDDRLHIVRVEPHDTLEKIPGPMGWARISSRREIRQDMTD
jgi:hypothetical protein